MAISLTTVREATFLDLICKIMHYNARGAEELKWKLQNRFIKRKGPRHLLKITVSECIAETNKMTLCHDWDPTLKVIPKECFN